MFVTIPLPNYRIRHWPLVPMWLNALLQRLLKLVFLRVPANFSNWYYAFFDHYLVIFPPDYVIFSLSKPTKQTKQQGRSPAKALEAYKKGHAFRAAVELCRASFPAQVTATEEAWGDHLCAQQQTDAAINHYIEAGATGKAVEAAIAARQWAKAASVVEVLDEKSAAPYAASIAEYYSAVGDMAQAERFYLTARDPKSAVDMYIKVCVSALSVGQQKKKFKLIC